MKKQKWDNPKTDKLFKTILNLKSLDEAKRFFRDLLTEGEIEEFANRLEVAKMLSQKISYSRIEKLSGMSSTTIARINKWLTRGMGGYKLLINRSSNIVNHHAPV